jgi:hypothetical protein
MAKNNTHVGALSYKDLSTISDMATAAEIPNPFKDKDDFLHLNNPDQFATIPGHVEQSISDMPIDKLREIYPEGIEVSGADIGKMQGKTLVPGGNIHVPSWFHEPTPHVYEVETPKNRAKNTNRQPNI